MKPIRVSLFCLLFGLLVGCGQLPAENFLSDNRLVESITTVSTKSELSEVAPPQVIRNLEKNLEQYRPQVRIVSPRAEKTYQQTDIKVELEVEDLPVFRDSKLGLGNHLNLIVDNEPIQQIYDVEESVSLKGLSPGSHSIRVFAATPWGESFKNEAAFAQTTFNILTETNDNRPNPQMPLLTYNSPSGTLGGEPFLLDFYLTNTPLHQIAQNNSEIEDWQIRATINGTSFLLDNWQPIYLTGLKSGENWVQLELVDEFGKNIENAFNNTVRVFNYNPQNIDTLAKLVTNKIDLGKAQALIEPNYYIQPVGAPEIIDLEPDVKSLEANIEQTPVKVNEAEIIDSSSKQDLAMPPVSTEPSQTTDESTESTQIDQAVSSTPLEENLNGLSMEDLSAAIPVVKEEKSSNLKQENDLEAPSRLSRGNSSRPAESVDTELVSPNQFEASQRLETADTAIAKKTESETLLEPSEEAPLVETKAETLESENIEANVDLPIAIPDSSSETYDKPSVQEKVALWCKKTLVTLRQGLESMAKLLPNKV